MLTQDRDLDPAAVAVEKELVVHLSTAASQADVKAFEFVPGYPFEITGVEAYCRTEAGVVTADVKVGGTSALDAALAFASGTRVAGTLHATQANRQGAAASAIAVHFTTDASGALTNGHVVVRYRARRHRGDPL